MNTPSPHPLPQGGEGLSVLSPLPEGEGWVRALFSYLFRFPREGGDPDPFAPAGSGKPAPPSASWRSASRRSNPGEHHVRRVSAPASLRYTRNDAEKSRQLPLPSLRSNLPPLGEVARSDEGRLLSPTKPQALATEGPALRTWACHPHSQPSPLARPSARDSASLERRGAAAAR